MGDALRQSWEVLQERLFFLPPFPEQPDALVLFGLLLISGLLVGEWCHRWWRLPKVVGYVLAGSLCGPSALGWISLEALAQIRPLADAALGLLMMEFGRRLDLGWWLRSRMLLRSTASDVVLTFLAVFAFAVGVAGMPVAWGAAAAAVTMASAPGVVLLTVEENRAQGQVTDRIVLHTAISAAASMLLFAVVVGVVHAQYSEQWANAFLHPLWVAAGSALIAWFASRIVLRVAQTLPKGSLGQVFVLVACALLAIGLSRMLACPVFLTLFLLGVSLANFDPRATLRYTSLPEAHWLLAIVLFVVTGASLPWHEMTPGLAGQALGLLLVRGAARWLAVRLSVNGFDRRKNLLLVMGTQPLSATAIFMAHEIAALYPEIGRSSLILPLFAAAIMELLGPLLCRAALRRAGESAPVEKPGIL